MFICVQKEEIIFLDIKVDDAVKLIISGGVLVPGMENEEDEEESEKK